jgi:hypothetical protein
MNQRLALVVSAPSAASVEEGAGIPVSRAVLNNTRLTPFRASSLLVMTRELALDVSAPGQLLFTRELQAAIGAAADALFFAAMVGDDTATQAISSSGTSGGAAKHDLREALMVVNSIGTPKLFWVVSVDVAKAASVLSTPDGLDVFPAMSVAGGELAALPAVVSAGIPSGTIYLIDGSNIAANAGTISVRPSGNADVLMDSAPSMDSSTPTPAQVVSMFQTNSVAMRADVWIGAAKLRDNAIAVIENVNWGGA